MVFFSTEAVDVKASVAGPGDWAMNPLPPQKKSVVIVYDLDVEWFWKILEISLGIEVWPGIIEVNPLKSP